MSEENPTAAATAVPMPRLYIRSRKMPATTVTQPTKTADE